MELKLTKETDWWSIGEEELLVETNQGQQQKKTRRTKGSGRRRGLKTAAFAFWFFSQDSQYLPPI